MGRAYRARLALQLVCLFAAGLSLAQSPLAAQAQDPAPAVAPDEAANALELKCPGEDGSTRNAGTYLWPLLDVVAINLTMWAVPYMLDVPWSKIGPEYWKQNFQTGFQWDDNEFEVNVFGHPYQGGLYFSAARVNGLTFWESVPYVVFGSFTWEFFLETEQPATNDLMSTTWGGVFFGEALYRLSNLIVDESQSGAARFWSEFAAFAVNPINGMDRLLSGRAWADGGAGKSVALRTTLRIGADGVGLSSGTGWGKTFRAWARFEYGDLYANPVFSTPFDYFRFSLQFSAASTIFGQGFDGLGVLMGQRFSMGSTDVNLFAWVLSYQYFTNGTTKMLTRDPTGVYQLGEMGTGPGWFSSWNLGHGFTLETELDALFVPTGSITSPYAKYDANRSYNFGIGGAAKLLINLRHKRLGTLYASVDRYLYYVVDGADGVEHVGTLQLGLYANIFRGHGLGVTAIRYDRNSSYDHYPDFSDAFWSGQVHYEIEF